MPSDPTIGLPLELRAAAPKAQAKADRRRLISHDYESWNYAPVAMTTSLAPVLEPLGVGEQLDAGFRLWRPQFGRLYLLSLVLTLPIALITFVYDATTIVEVGSGGIVFVDDPDSFRAVSSSLAN